MKLKTKITFVTLAIVLTLFVLAMIINTAIFYKEAKGFRNSEIISSFEFFLNQINHATNNTESIGYDLARSGEILYILKKNDTKEQQKIFEQYLIAKITNEKSILGGGLWYEPNRFIEKYTGPYALWDKEKVVMSWEYSNPNYDYHNQPYYRIAIPKDWDTARKRDQSIFRIPPYLDKIGDKEIIFVTVSSIMYDTEERILGLTTVDWSFEDLNRILGEFNVTKSSYTVLFDIPSSKIVFYPDKNFIMQDVSTLKWTEKIKVVNLEKNKILKIENELIDGIEYDIYYAVTNSDYLLAAVINTKEAYSVIGGIVFRNALLSIITLILVGVCIFIVVGLSIKPLNDIINVLRGITSGRLDLKERIHIESKDEFGELANTFNNMADKIESQNHEIKEYSEGLEDKVIVRTRELEVEKQKTILRMNEFEKYNKALNYLARSRAIAMGDLDKALDEFTEVGSRVLEVERVSIWKYDKRKKTIISINLLEKTKNEHSKGIELFEKDFPIYFQHIREERILTVYDVYADLSTQEFSEYYARNNIYSVLDVPIWSMGYIVGLLSFEHTEYKRNWTQEEESFAASISSLISTAFESDEKNLAQIKETQAKAEIEFANHMTIQLIESPSLDDSLKLVFNYIMITYELDILALYFIQDGTNKAMPYKVEGDNVAENKLEYIKNTMSILSDNSIFTIALKRKKNTFIQKLRIGRVRESSEREFAENLELKSLLCIPIRVGERNLGMFVIYNIKKYLTFTSDELDSISRLSFQIAGVIQKGRIFQEVEAAKIEIEKLNQITKKINSVSNLVDVMTFIMFYLEMEYHFTEFWLLLKGENSNHLNTFSYFSAGLSEESEAFFKKFTFDLDKESYLGHTYREQKIFYMPLSGNEQLSAIDLQIIENGKFSFILQIPLVIYDKTIGILCLHKKTWKGISEDTFQKLQTFANQVAGAVYNSKLFEQAQEAKQQAEIEKGIAVFAQQEAEMERGKSEKLLLNILPEEVAEELKEKGSVQPVYFENATIMFTDFKGFTQIAEGLTPHKLIKELDDCFSQFDKITERCNLEKLKTIGDSYMCAGGLPRANKTHAIDSCLAALEILSFMGTMMEQKQIEGNSYWELRIGIHSGAVMAGVVGEKKFAYDVWGDTVNTASRMESSGTPGMINISYATYGKVELFFDCEYRGELDAKNKGKIKMYYLKRIKYEYAKDKDGYFPNEKFWELYTTV